MRRDIVPISLWTLLAIGLGAVVAVSLLFSSIKAPYKGYESDSVLVRIPPRSSTLSILRALEEGGVIRDVRIGYITLRVLHRGKTLRAGEYRFRGPRTVEQVILTIAAGDVVTYRVTVPEGLSAEEIFSLFSSQEFGSATEFAQLFLRPQDFEGVPAGAPNLEGFLFPETYVITRSTTAKDIVAMLTHQFIQRLPENYARKAKSAGLSVLEAVTVASLIEKETGLDSERPLIAAVFHNRLRQGMAMQCDPTTIYALKRLGVWKGYLTRSDLSVVEPYNTYVIPALPPGPICSPSLPSLRAAVAPAETDYLYFVAKGDGSHLFASDYESQQRNVALYREYQRSAREAVRAAREGTEAVPTN
jgi:UPF0755 protein